MSGSAPSSYRVHWQDFTHKRPGDKMPEKHSKDFPSQDEANAHKAFLKATIDGVIATVTPIVPKAPRATKASLSGGFDRVKGGRRLTA